MKIAIVKLSSLGDIVHAMVALQFIKAFDSTIQIDWIVEQAFLPILENNPDINVIYPVSLKALRQNKSLLLSEFKKIRHIAKNNYDLVIDAQGLIKSAMVAKICGKKIVGFNKNSIREKLATYFYDIKIDSPYHENAIDRNAKILSNPLGFSINSEQIFNKLPFLFFRSEDDNTANYFRHDLCNIIFVMSSSWDSKNYPAAKFVELANTLQQNCLVIWGNESEKEKAEWVAMQSNYIQVMPKLSLNNLKSLIAHADLVIGNDSGPTHIAWALNRPSITLYGCTSIRQSYQTTINKVLKSPSVVNPYRLNKNDYSIGEIEVSQILTLAKQLLFN